MLRARDVREALADYDRITSEFEGFYALGGSSGVLWMWKRLPARQRESYEAACRGTVTASASFMLDVCPFEWDFDVERLRGELQQDGALRLVRLTANRNLAAVRVTDEVLDVAERLEAVLASALAAL